jgi:hypothetical protein
VLVLALVAGCGGEKRPAEPVSETVGYAPRAATWVAMAPTDLDGTQLQRLGRLLAPALDGQPLREALSSVAEQEGIRFEHEVAPLLGSTLVAWAEDGTLVFALETTDGEKARDLLRSLRVPGVAVDGDTVLITEDGKEARLDAAIARRDAGDGLDPAAVARAFGDEMDEPALLRVTGDPHAIARDLDVDVDVPWIRALRSAAVTIRLESDAITAHLQVRTDPDGLDEDDLPLATGDDAPPAGSVDGALNGANRDQSRTTVFLARLAREAFPDSDFVREVEKVEADLGISFEDEVLKQFNGPSASVALPDGEFAAVSEIDDPDRMRELLPRLAPRLPAVIRGLHGLGDQGLVALLVLAPDAPLVPGSLPLLASDIEVDVLRGSGDEQLYEITGLQDDDRDFAVPSVVFGMIGDRFVVATDTSQAKAAAKMDLSDVDGADGAAVVRTDFSTWRKDTRNPFPINLAKLGEAIGELEASTEGLDGRVRIEVPGGL